MRLLSKESHTLLLFDRKRKRKKEKGMKKEKERVKIRVIVGPFKNVISSSIEIGDNARVFLIVKKLEK
jgi:hypothetical protein